MTLPPEDDLELLEEEIRVARRRRDSLERAPREGRFTGDAVDFEDQMSAAQRRIRLLERQRADLLGRIRDEEEAYA